MSIYHNSQQMLYRSPFGAVPAGTPVTLRLALKSSKFSPQVILRVWKEGVEHQIPMEPVGYAGSLQLYEGLLTPEHTGLYWYYFIVKRGRKTLYYCNNPEFLGGEGKLYSQPSHSFQLTVYQQNPAVPAWLRQGIMYQIFVDRFYRSGEILPKNREYYYHTTWGETPRYDLTDRYGAYSNRDFFGGNLEGIIEKLPYLSSLGVTVLYLNPIFDAFSNHKYDTGDFETVDAMFGGNEAFTRLCQAAKKQGIRLVLDGVFNHTGSDSKYFNKEGNYPTIGAYQSQESPYYSWYRFGSFPDAYDSWWGIKTLPAVEESDPSFQEYMLGSNGIVRRWLRAGASGWRLDVADELPDDFLDGIYQAAKKERPDAAIIGEVWEDASHKVSYGQPRRYLQGGQMDSVMNYPWKEAVLDFITERTTSQTLRRRLLSLWENYPKDIFFSLMNSLGTHDVPRVLTLLGDAPATDTLTRAQQSRYRLTARQRTLAKKRLRLATLLQFTLPGLPCIYYGEEAGMEGMDDPFNRGCYPWGQEDKQVLRWYHQLTAFRQKHPVLQTGHFHLFDTPKSAFACLRYPQQGRDAFDQPLPDLSIVVVINASSTSSVTVTLDGSPFSLRQLTKSTDKSILIGANGQFSLTLPPLGFAVYQAK